MTENRIGRRSVRCRAVALAPVLVLAWVGNLQADGPGLITRDGKRIALQRAEGEVAVVLEPAAAEDKVAARMRATGVGDLEDFDHAPLARVKRMRVPRVTSAARRALLQDPAVVEVRPIYRVAGKDAPLVSTGTINVRVREDLGQADRAKLWRDYHVAVVRELEWLDNVYVVIPTDDEDEDVSRAEHLSKDPRTVWAQPNFRSPVRQTQLAPQDALYSRQWHLNNTGQAGGLADADIDAPEAWVRTAGQDVLFGMFDDSCDVDHPDLRGGYTGIGQDPALPLTSPGVNDPRPKSIGDAHGTAVMGLAAARANTIGVRGVAYLTQFTASRGLNDFINDADIASVYNFALQQEVDVHINSWGLIFGSVPAIIEEAIDRAYNDGRDLDGEEGPELPRGMVIVFASGNEGTQLSPGDDFSTLESVIGIGASNVADQVTSYSNYGRQIDVLAPGGDFSGFIATTDNNDGAGYIDDGYNVGGFDPFTGEADIEPTGLYTGTFTGTSAACPVAAGVAGLILSANPTLSADDVRLILEHTADRVSPQDAGYDPITKRSLRYGYGRVNADRAVEAADFSIESDGRTWPLRVGNVSAQNNELRFTQNGNLLEFRFLADPPEPDDENAPPEPTRTTDEFLIIASDSPFTFSADEFPVDGVCYDERQLGCSSTPLQTLPDGVEVLAVGCNLTCVGTAGGCEAGAEQCVSYLQPAGTRHFGIYARNRLGRYSFGVKADSQGNVLDPGNIKGTTGGGGGGGGEAPVRGPKVSINVSPLSGESPLLVNFMGNATSDKAIDNSATAWDFDIEDGSPVDATSRNASHTYVVPAGQSRTFVARLTMSDVDGESGFAQVAVRVDGPGGGDDPFGNNDVSIVVGVPGTVGSDVDTGTSPFAVQLSVNTSGLVGTLQSVRWDLGDGTTSTSLFVTHTFVNETEDPLRLPISAVVTTVTPGGASITSTTSRTITILPGTGNGNSGEPPDLPGTGAEGPGGSAVPCGMMGIVPLVVLPLGMLGLRRRRR